MLQGYVGFPLDTVGSTQISEEYPLAHSSTFKTLPFSEALDVFFVYVTRLCEEKQELYKGLPKPPSWPNTKKLSNVGDQNRIN